ncbi:hypothetical protein GCM10008959_31590 [Deinococcus seoulensis]|uniref:Uncharacterized protein n=1 Tax=Deinococcus seoulensis TaxID=1837379 RepID=A0ABQ2RU47_9DEIO|nr:hypothetical protein [Deinococcus seoulensis]GGR67098.1 hypothetical protein GCM10008959_31590 [Deinococcus seoulensis]
MRRSSFLALATSLSVGVASAQTGMNVFSFNNASSSLLLTWTEAGGQLTGSLQVVTGAARAEGPQFDVTTNVVRGTRNGASYSFVLENKLAFFGASALSGTLTKDTLTLTVPRAEGGFAAFPLARTTLPKFNTAVATLRASVTQRSQTLATEARQRAEQAAVQRAAEAARLQAAQRLNDALNDYDEALLEANDVLTNAQDTLNALARTFGDIQSVQVGKGEVIRDLKRLATEKDCFQFNERKADLYGYGLVSLTREGQSHVNMLKLIPARLDEQVQAVNEARAAFAGLKGKVADLAPDQDLTGRSARMKAAISQRVAGTEAQLASALSADQTMVAEAEAMVCSPL